MTSPDDESLPYPSYNDPFPSLEEVHSWYDLPDDEMWRRRRRMAELNRAYFLELRGGRELVPGVDYSVEKIRFDSDHELNGMAEWARRQGLIPDSGETEEIS